VTKTASNFALEPTAYSFGFAYTSGGGSPRALGCNEKRKVGMRPMRGDAMWCNALGWIVTLTLSLLVAPLAAEAQPVSKVRRIGWLSVGHPHSGPNPYLDAFREELRELGWVEGQNLAIEYRFAEGRPEQLPALAAELVRLRVDVIFASTSREVQAAKDATTTIPIVFRGATDARLDAWGITSLARPGGNLTGLTMTSEGYEQKRLELLTRAVPGVTRVAVLVDPAPGQRSLEETATVQALRAVAQALGVQLQFVEAKRPEDFDGAFAMTRERAEALYVTISVTFFQHHPRLMALALERRLPTMYWRAELAEAGSLMSYGSSLVDDFRRAAAYVGKILRGAKPGDLPIERPMKFELVINLKTAQALGLTIPPTLLFEADKVIR
jgi:putative ABC transport system substrate-binding protein